MMETFEKFYDIASSILKEKRYCCIDFNTDEKDKEEALNYLRTGVIQILFVIDVIDERKIYTEDITYVLLEFLFI